MCSETHNNYHYSIDIKYMNVHKHILEWSIWTNCQQFTRIGKISQTGFPNPSKYYWQSLTIKHSALMALIITAITKQICAFDAKRSSIYERMSWPEALILCKNGITKAELKRMYCIVYWLRIIHSLKLGYKQVSMFTCLFLEIVLYFSLYYAIECI